jgi:hypothetical protein
LTSLQNFDAPNGVYARLPFSFDLD